MLNLDLSIYNWELFSSYILKGLLFSVQLTVVATIGGIFFWHNLSSDALKW